jgi:large subunit ribosomal protein L31
MKKGLHPDYVECTVHCSCGNTFTTRATKPQLRVELCNECHPFYTGQQKFVDTGGRVQRFADKFGSASAAVAEREAVKREERLKAAAAAEAAAKAAREEKAAAKAAKAAKYAERSAKTVEKVVDEVVAEDAGATSAEPAEAAEPADTKPAEATEPAEPVADAAPAEATPTDTEPAADAAPADAPGADAAS